MRKSYTKGKIAIPVLQGIDLEVERGEHVAVVGASGSGKSTLLHVLGLLDAPDSGTVQLDGRRLEKLPERQRDDLRNRTFGFIFQFYHLLPELTALENVMMPQLIRHGLWSYLTHRAALRKEASGRRAWARHRPGRTLPGTLHGKRQARGDRGLAGGPAVLLADEPTGNLDAASGQGVLDLLRDLNRERGLTMIMVTHDIQIAQQADRIVRLRWQQPRNGPCPGVTAGREAVGSLSDSVKTPSRQQDYCSRARTTGN